MGKYIAQHIIKILVRYKLDLSHARIGLLGLSYKEDCSDIRNTKVIDIIEELQEYGVHPILVDPLVDQREFYSEYGLELTDPSDSA